MSDIEYRIHRGMNQLAPDVFQSILSDNSPRLDSEVWLKPQERREQRVNMWMRTARTAAAFAACLAVVFGAGTYYTTIRVDSVVELDVNPSLELEINSRDRVVRVHALNEDGIKIIDDTEIKLEQVKLESAIQTLVNTMVRDEFLDEEKSSVLVSVSHGNEKKSEKLQRVVADNVKEALSEDQITGVVYHQAYTKDSETTEISDKYEISPGKAAFIRSLISMNPAFTYEELAGLTISEITELLDKEKLDVEALVAKNQSMPVTAAGQPSKDEMLQNSSLTSKDSEGIKEELDKEELYRKEKEINLSRTAADDVEVFQPEDNGSGVLDKDVLQKDMEVVQGSDDSSVLPPGTDSAAGGSVQGSVPPDLGSSQGGTSAGQAGRPGDTGTGSSPEQPSRPPADTEVPEVPPTKPDDRPNPGDDLIGEPELPDDPQLGGGSNASSNWEQIENLPELLHKSMEDMKSDVEELLLQIPNLALVEDETAKEELYNICSLLYMKSRNSYDICVSETREMIACGALDQPSVNRVRKNLKYAKRMLIRAAEELDRQKTVIE